MLYSNIKLNMKSYCIAFFCIAFTAFHNQASAEVYRLGALDKISIKVFEYRTSIGEIYEWKSLNGAFILGAGGEISIPLIGTIQASGMTTVELGAAVATQMSQSIGLAAPPFVAIEVTEYRPIYIVGNVDKPGEYPYRPGLTVLQAMGIAGGLPKLTDTGVLRLRREVISQRGDVQQLNSELQALVVRKARLIAEMGDAETILFPGEIEKRKSDASVTQLVQQETSIFNARRTALKTELAALAGLKDFLIKEVGSLEAQVIAQRKERTTVQKELDTVTALVEKGLSGSPRQLGLERTMAQMEGDRLRLETLLLKARQEISRAEISILETSNKRATEITVELRETEAKLELTVSKFRVADKLLSEAQISAPSVAGGTRRKPPEPVFSIVRNVSGAVQELQASERLQVQPGDTIKVYIPPPEDGVEELLQSPSN